jgi:hypothetical protein
MSRDKRQLSEILGFFADIEKWPDGHKKEIYASWLATQIQLHCEGQVLKQGDIQPTIINTAMETKKTGRKSGKIYPHTWVSGPDPVRHEQHRVWTQQRNQALWRKEEWNLDFETWIIMWGELWYNRGRGREDYCMTRLDHDLPWDKDNAVVVTRKQHLKQHRDRCMSLGLVRKKKVI